MSKTKIGLVFLLTGAAITSYFTFGAVFDQEMPRTGGRLLGLILAVVGVILFIKARSERSNMGERRKTGKRRKKDKSNNSQNK